MLKIRPLSDELQKMACDELNEDPERLQSDIENLRNWIKQNPQIRSREDDQFLVGFLRGSKSSLEKAKKKIESFYLCRSVMPEFFKNRDPQDEYLQEILSLGLILPLPVDESKTENRIVLTRLGGYDYNKYDFMSVMKVTYWLADRCVIDSDVTIISGHVNVVDLRGCGISLMSQITPTIIKKLSTLLEPFPVRIKAIHLVNPPKGIDTAFRLFMSVVNDKLKNRIFMHESFEDLHKVLSRENLPIEYGGTNKSIPEITEEWRKHILKHREWFLEDYKYGVEKSQSNSDYDSATLFGVEGSFRSLNID